MRCRPSAAMTDPLVDRLPAGAYRRDRPPSARPPDLRDGSVRVRATRSRATTRPPSAAAGSDRASWWTSRRSDGHDRAGCADRGAGDGRADGSPARGPSRGRAGDGRGRRQGRQPVDRRRQRHHQHRGHRGIGPGAAALVPALQLGRSRGTGRCHRPRRGRRLQGHRAAGEHRDRGQPHVRRSSGSGCRPAPGSPTSSHRPV